MGGAQVGAFVVASVLLILIPAVDMALARVSGWLRRSAVQRGIERGTGAVLIALGVRLAVER